VKGVQEAMANKDFERAAGFLHQYLRYDKTLVAGIFSEYSLKSSPVSPKPPESSQDPSAKQHTAESIAEIMAGAVKQLLEVASKEFDDAVASGDEDKLMRFFKLFPLFGEHFCGLEKYGSYLRGVIAKACRDSRTQCDANSKYIT
jgi:hypothetical protein